MSKLPIGNCTGCTACASICPQDCINMVFNDEGFLYPSIDIDKCTNCGLCEEICPLIKPLNREEFEPKAYAAYSVDEEIRLESSSGGIFSEIARFCQFPFRCGIRWSGRDCRKCRRRRRSARCPHGRWGAGDAPG